MAISTIGQNGLTNPLPSLASNTIASGTGSALTFQTNGSTTAMTIDTSQRVSIGGTTVTDYHLLNIQGPTTTNNVGVVLNDTTNSKIYAIDNGGTALKFFDYTANTERMRIDTSGNVGIGTTSPSTKLDITNGYTTDNNTSFTLTNSQGSSGDNGAISYRTYTGSGYMTSAQINSGPGSAFNASYLKFRVADSSQTLQERMRIDSSGNLLIGTSNSTPSAANPGVRISLPDTASIWARNGTSTVAMINFVNGNGTVGHIDTSGSNTSYVTSSDYRLKENVQPMQNALGTVAQLNPVTYTWKADGSDGQGFIAHELQAIVPDCVVGEKDAVDDEGNPVYQGVDTSFLVATLTKAIQELKAEVDELKMKLEAK